MVDALETGAVRRSAPEMRKWCGTDRRQKTRRKIPLFAGPRRFLLTEPSAVVLCDLS